VHRVHLRRWGLALLLAVAASVDRPAGGSPTGAQGVGIAEGSVLAVSGIQVAWLNLQAPRPRRLTSLAAPAAATHVGAMPGWPRAVVSVATAFPGGGTRGADLALVDLAAGSLTPLAGRTDAAESLVMPFWWPDGNAVAFERDDLTGQTVGAPGQEVPRYPSRIEIVGADGKDRWILEPNGREPAPAPDGSRVVFARTTRHGASLLSWVNGDGAEQTLVPEGRFADIAYPRFSPSGEEIAFVAPQSGLGASAPTASSVAPALQLQKALFLSVAVAWAHGIPWDPWIMRADGSGLRRAAVVGGDEPSVAWSPDGAQLFIYSGVGSTVVDARSGESTPLSFVRGYGPTAWLPDQP
jgi:hypothetical protein